MSGERAWLIDASIYIFRAWFSLPADRWSTHSGQPLHAVYGYTKFLLDFIDQAGKSFLGAAAFDESLGSNYRNDIYPAYKSSRELPDDDLAFQLRACREVSERLGIACYGGSRYEADDYLASLARVCNERQLPITVVTRDKDLGQIIQGPSDYWWDYAQGERLDGEAFRQKFGVQPHQFADYLALVGDPVDDIPGVPGIGAKTAARLLQTFDNLDSLAKGLGRVHELDIRGAARVKQKLQEHWSQVLLARQLTALETNIPDIGDVPEFALTGEGARSALDYLTEINLTGPLTRRCQQFVGELPAT